MDNVLLITMIYTIKQQVNSGVRISMHICDLSSSIALHSEDFSVLFLNYHQEGLEYGKVCFDKCLHRNNVVSIQNMTFCGVESWAHLLLLR